MPLDIRVRWIWRVVKPLLVIFSLLALLKIVMLPQIIEYDNSTVCYIEDLDPECFHAATLNKREKRNTSRRSTFEGNHKIKETALQMKEILTKLKAQAIHMKELNLLEDRTDYLLSLYEEIDEEETPEIEKTKSTQPLLVCPETYLGSTKGYPFFYTGFAITNCTSTKPFHRVLSVLINLIEHPIDLSKMLHQISKSYPNISVSVATTQEEHTKLRSASLNLQVHKFDEGTSPVKAWNSLIMNASTPYVLVTRGMINFSWDVRLERLVREAQLQNMDFVGGAIRNEFGNWDLGCYQTRNRNYSLEYISGYYYSYHECLHCSYLAGPFVARTEAIQYLRLHYDVAEQIAFEDLFFRFTHKHRSHSLLCPDAMFYVHDSSMRYSKERTWKEFSKKYLIDKVRLPTGKILDLCSSSACSKSAQRSLPRCCMEDLSFAIKILMKNCESLGMMCELQEGSLLGGVKFGGILPWERDADITFHTQNFTSLEELSKLIHPYGLNLRLNSVPWCCVDGVEAGGIAVVQTKNWHIEMYGQHLMDSEKLRKDNLPPTRLRLDGQWVAVPHNPGLYVRNRYGKEIYRHAVHWMSQRMKTGWGKYDTTGFPKCNDPGNHFCLDQYSTDGNIQFRDDP